MCAAPLSVVHPVSRCSRCSWPTYSGVDALGKCGGGIVLYRHMMPDSAGIRRGLAPTAPGVTLPRRVAQGLADQLNGALNRTVSDSRLSVAPIAGYPDAFELTRIVEGNDAPLDDGLKQDWRLRRRSHGREASSAGTSVLDRMNCARVGSSRSAIQSRSSSLSRRSVSRSGSWWAARLRRSCKRPIEHHGRPGPSS